ncbi:hypothetical protein HMPREF0380_00884 [Eubacterium infirmum F0142]|nr:hypothetical protein HMPREF0380_00884 [Eubacterium infirmum F0142]
MRVKKTSTALEKYLYQVDRRLRHMSVTEKTDILSELKNSFYERQKKWPNRRRNNSRNGIN